MSFTSASSRSISPEALGPHKGIAAGIFVYDEATDTWQPYVKGAGDDPMRRAVRLDAFGRQRVSQPFTIFDSKLVRGKADLFFDEETSGTSSIVFNSGDASVTLSASGSGAYAIRQTKMRFDYQPGKSQEFKETFVLGAPVPNTTVRFGYFNTEVAAPYDNEKDGLYIERDGSGYWLCMAKTGVVTRVHQNDWNIDKFTGDGPSQYTIDFTKGQIFHCDFEWLGVGDPMMGFYIGRELWPAHVFHNANSVTGVYMSSPNHSIRYEVRSDGGAASTKAICSTVVSEGGLDPVGIGVGLSTAGTGVSVSNNVDTAILAVRLKSGMVDATTVPSLLSVLSSTKSNFEWWISYNPLISGTYSWSDKGNTAFQVATGPYIVTGRGHEILNGYVSETSDAGSESIDSVIRLGAGISGDRDVFAVCVRPLGGNETFYGALNFKERSIG